MPEKLIQDVRVKKLSVNSDERAYSQGFNLVNLLSAKSGGAHHVITKRRVMKDYSIKGIYPLVPLITTASPEATYLKGQQDRYRTALLDFDGNERASIHLRHSTVNTLQILLLQLQRRVQSRVPLPAIRLDADYLNGLLASPPILQFEHLKVDWSDLRFLLRSVASAMRTHDALDETDFRRVEALTRDSDRLAGIVQAWYESVRKDAPPLDPEIAGLELVIQQAMRPTLSRAAEAIMARSTLQGWHEGSCPLCGGEPDLAVITPAAGERWPPGNSSP